MTTNALYVATFVAVFLIIWVVYLVSQMTKFAATRPQTAVRRMPVHPLDQVDERCV